MVTLLIKFKVGLNVPKVDAKTAKKLYNSLTMAIEEGLVKSAHGCYKGGLGIALSQSSFAGGYGMEVDLGDVPREGLDRDDKIFYSESASRFVVTVSPKDREEFEKIMAGNVYSMIGKVSENRDFEVIGVGGDTIIREDIYTLKESWKNPLS